MKNREFSPQQDTNVLHEGELVQEKMLLQGWDPTDPVAAIAFYPKKQYSLPLVALFHGFAREKEALVPWAPQFASKGFFVLAIDLPFHGERKPEGVFNPNMNSLEKGYNFFVHQSSIAHAAYDFPYMLSSLENRKEVDLKHIGVAGISVGGSLALVLAWREKSISAVASLIGACDFWWDVTKTPPGPLQEEKKRSYSPRMIRLISSLDPRPRVNLMPPKAVFMANGRYDNAIDIASVRQFSAEIGRCYESFPDHLRFLEEEVGHKATDTMRCGVEEWFTHFLK